MIVNLPPPVFSPLYLTNLVTALKAALMNAVSSQEGTPRLILISPNGTNYSVTVANDGTLHTAVNAGRVAP